MWVIGELGSAPLANYFQSRILEEQGPASVAQGTSSVAQGFSPVWDRGYCPSCGSWPAFIERLARRSAPREGGHLRCSYCVAAWQLSSQRCVYCGNSDERFVVAAPDLARPERRVELCGACGGYTKSLDAPSLTPFPLIAIEDLATMDLDEGAMSRGYHRPDLIDLDTIDPPATPKLGSVEGS